MPNSLMCDICIYYTHTHTHRRNVYLWLIATTQ